MLRAIPRCRFVEQDLQRYRRLPAKPITLARQPHRFFDMVAASRVVIGTSGWRYRSWRATFYPPGLRQRDDLAFVSRRFASVEINGTFYSLQRPGSFRAWREATPDGFAFAVKGIARPEHPMPPLRLKFPGS